MNVKHIAEMINTAPMIVPASIIIPGQFHNECQYH